LDAAEQREWQKVEEAVKRVKQERFGSVTVRIENGKVVRIVRETREDIKDN